MFDQLKKLKELKELNDSLGKERIEEEKDGIRVVINGKMEVESIELNAGLSKEEQEKKLQECINSAMKKMQMIVAQRMSGMMNF